MVHRLAGNFGAAVWPFDPPRSLTLAEVYPSLLPPDPREPIRDAGQVRAMLRARLWHREASRLHAALNIATVEELVVTAASRRSGIDTQRVSTG